MQIDIWVENLKTNFEHVVKELSKFDCFTDPYFRIGNPIPWRPHFFPVIMKINPKDVYS